MAAAHPSTRKWRIVATYWLLQALVIYAAGVLWMAAAVAVDGPKGSVFPLPGREDLTTEFIKPPPLLAGFVLVILITAAQAIFLFPVRRPAPAAKRGASVYSSLAVAAIGLAMIVAGLVFAAAELLEVLEGWNPMRASKALFFGIAAATGVVSWAIATPLLIAFSRRTPRESLLARTAELLFAGTIVEAAAVIPLDIMVRRRTSCYCDTGTFFTLMYCGAVGLFTLGPAIFLPLLAKRRRAFHRTHCTACGYDMAAIPDANRCPECGTPHRVLPAQPARVP